ncbi:hypothetical protein BDV95DRAFT_593908 [Massariosphaeria phaeospora]|uniref:Uncharacterized protein n=1 Tax=Massariosphaeria phaeospora TaxID=100035 RepID=A0A7C8MBL8_9PLEO|nr:hypothetical protein BDV95DRAFT_593908 [Massariosphaeria phaeospora]
MDLSNVMNLDEHVYTGQPEHSISSRLQSMAIRPTHEHEKTDTLPSIHELGLDTFRRPSTSSVSSSSTTSSGPNSTSSSPVISVRDQFPTSRQQDGCRRLRQIQGQLHPYPRSQGFWTPYPTPSVSPHIKPAKPSRSNRAVNSSRRTQYKSASDSDSNTHFKTELDTTDERRSYEALKAMVLSEEYSKASHAPDSARKNTKDRKPDPVKAAREQGARKIQTCWLSELQNVQLATNPNLPLVAAQKQGQDRPGWTPLKSNNINKKVRKQFVEVGLVPLLYNKNDVIETGVCTLKQHNRFHALLPRLILDPKLDRNELASRIQELVSSFGTDSFETHMAALEAWVNRDRQRL